MADEIITPDISVVIDSTDTSIDTPPSQPPQIATALEGALGESGATATVFIDPATGNLIIRSDAQA